MTDLLSSFGLVVPDRYVSLQQRIDEPVAEALLTPAETEIRNQVREVVATKIAPRAAETDLTHEFAHRSYRALAAAGLGGIALPVEYGGSGASTVAYALAVQEVATGCGATSLIYMTQTHTANPIVHTGSKELAERYLCGLIYGRSYGSFAITEPDAGSDTARMRTTALRTPEGYRISGSKTFITTGDRADLILLFATTDRSLGRNGITAFLVPGYTPGISRGQPFAKMGMHGSSTAEIFFDNARIPLDHALGQPGQGWPILMNSVIKSRISAAAQGVGLARSAYGRTLDVLHELHGKNLPGDFSQRLADMRGRILEGQLLLLNVARRVDSVDLVEPTDIAIMKQKCTDLGFTVACEAAGLLGPYGDLVEVGVERMLRDAKATQIYDGTNEIQLVLIARDTSRRMK